MFYKKSEMVTLVCLIGLGIVTSTTFHLKIQDVVYDIDRTASSLLFQALAFVQLIRMAIMHYELKAESEQDDNNDDVTVAENSRDEPSASFNPSST